MAFPAMRMQETMIAALKGIAAPPVPQMEMRVVMAMVMTPALVKVVTLPVKVVVAPAIAAIIRATEAMRTAGMGTAEVMAMLGAAEMVEGMETGAVTAMAEAATSASIDGTPIIIL